jgi:hypothetical protein
MGRDVEFRERLDALQRHRRLSLVPQPVGALTRFAATLNGIRPRTVERSCYSRGVWLEPDPDGAVIRDET